MVMGGAFIATLILRFAFVEAYKIPSESMIPTLLVGDNVLANKFIYQRFSQRFNRHINITWARGDFIRNGGSIQHCSGLGGNEGTGAKGRLARWGYEPGEDKRG